MSSNLPVINLMGPTASGKTALACELYERGHFEIISVDSALIYRDMDIGTAKVIKEEMDGIPHHMIDILNPDDTFSAYDFKQRAEKCINDIIQRGKTPIVAGGTGLYIQSLLYNYQFEDETVSEEKMKEVKSKLNELANLNNNELHLIQLFPSNKTLQILGVQP